MSFCNVNLEGVCIVQHQFKNFYIACHIESCPACIVLALRSMFKVAEFSIIILTKLTQPHLDAIWKADGPTLFVASRSIFIVVEFSTIIFATLCGCFDLQRSNQCLKLMHSSLKSSPILNDLVDMTK